MAAPYEKQVIVVDDGSTDKTADALGEWEGHPQLVLLQHSSNQGKGAAIRTGLDCVECPYTVVQDADLEYDPNDYPVVIEPLLRGEAEAVYGSRYLRGAAGGRRWGLSRCGVLVLNVCAQLLYGVRLTDEATCYKAFPTALLRKMDLQCERFEFCPEVTAKACRLGVRILEVPVHYDARSRRAGKKIRWTDGLEALATLWRWRRWRPDQAKLINR
jgi:glycosyltransferase involved in cell wall biosynthesis